MANQDSVSKEVQKFNFLWTVDNFSKVTADGIVKTLIPKDVANIIMPEWSVQVRISIEKARWLCMGLNLTAKQGIDAKFKVSVVNKRMEKIMLYKTTRITSSTNLEKIDYLINKSLLSSEENGFVTEDRLTCLLEVDCFVQIKDEVQSLQNSPNDLSSCFTQLFETKQCSDVILNVGECAIKAHKAILIARSPVFAAMFQHDMQEHQLNSITISDIGPKVVEEMLRFIYTDDIPNLVEMADLLLEAADKYDIPNLKSKCEKSLVASIANDNATCTLMLADRYNAEHLKAETLDYISYNASDVMETKDWQEMIQIGGNVHLVGEAFRALALEHDS